MDFSIDLETRMIVENARRFLEREIAPEVPRFKDRMIPRDDLTRLLPLLKPFGFLGVLVPESEGGNGLDFLTSMMLYEELFRVFPGLGGTAFVNQVAACAIHREGTREQRERYLPGLLAGELIGAQAATEPEVGSNPRDIRMRARDEDGSFRIDGRKIWISNGSVADFVIVLAKTDAGEATRFLVDREPAGFTSRELPTLGQENWSTAELHFDNLLLPPESRLGVPGQGANQVMMDFSIARCFVSMAAIGMARAAHDLAIDYARTRQQWGKPIGQHQLVQEMVADMAVDLECAKLLAYQAAYWVSVGENRTTDAAIAKLFTSEAAIRITSNALQIHGALGLSRDLPLEGLFRSARMMTIPDGTTQLQKLIVARDRLKMNAFGDAR